MTLAEQAWLRSGRVVQAIKCHPFNQELMRGTLARAKFIHYLRQDVLYLQDFARCRDVLVSRLPSKWQPLLIKDTTAECEQTAVHRHFVDLQRSFPISAATSGYTKHLADVCEFRPVELGVAAMLPCYWIYKELGLCMAASPAASDHPYKRWIETYAGDKLEGATNNMISLFNSLAEQTTMRQKMLDIFHKSVCLEWHFWNDAYHHQLDEACTCECDFEDSATATFSPALTASSETEAVSEVLMVGHSIAI